MRCKLRLSQLLLPPRDLQSGTGPGLMHFMAFGSPGRAALRVQ